ncbi:unnamed protein product [Rotaria magnacalcarata]|uniref:DDE Tnp4 domain-containing protein n=2 Tax=Rotaria magnacalcarata TaxID=392030 RepID=A0A816UF09_9BILA|nr:unnamed protein product [Rotaria magnacalcarata]CAF2108301.1 unnamed protein product [Rotaria magnacalcarata]
MEVDEQVDMALERIDTEVQTTPDIESVELLVDRTSKSEQGCIVCGVGKGVKRYRLTDVQRDNFNHLLKYLSTMRNSSARSIRIALAIYLTKLRQGISNSVLATIFRLGDKRLVSHILQQVRQHLKSNFVSQHLGFIDITREEVLTHHQTTIANKLLTSQSDQVCVAIDGTYMYIQKSSNNTFQRRTYSMHKHHNLLKPMIITTTDGYILSVLGPYFADYKNNDASIIKYCLMNNEQDMLSWFKDDDIMIVDRGVRCI